VKKALPLLLLLFLGLAACNSGNTENGKTDAPPADLIPRETMVKVLKDVHLLEATLAARKTAVGITDPVGDFDVFKKNGVTREQYDRSIGWYSKHLEEFKEIYNTVFDELKSEQSLQQKPGTAAPAANAPPQQPGPMKPQPVNPKN
jgi:hypothetical protein